MIFMLPWMTGYYLFNQVETYIIENHKVIAIQPNINLFNKRDFSKRFDNMKKLIERSKKYIDNGSDLIIWPESALPYNNIQDKNTLNYIQKTVIIFLEDIVFYGMGSRCQAVLYLPVFTFISSRLMA